MLFIFYSKIEKKQDVTLQHFLNYDFFSEMCHSLLVDRIIVNVISAAGGAGILLLILFVVVRYVLCAVVRCHYAQHKSTQSSSQRQADCRPVCCNESWHQ